MARPGTTFCVATLTAAAVFASPGAPAGAVVLQAQLDISFAVPSIPQGGNTTMTFTVSNPNTLASLTGIGFTDTLPSGLTFNIAGTNGCGGMLTQTATSLTLSQVSLAPRHSCSITGSEVVGTSAGTKTTSATVSSSNGTGNTASASLAVVAPPEVSDFFTDAGGGGSPDWIDVGGIATVDIGVSNPNTDSSLTGVGLNDTLPSGLVVADPSNVVTGGSCSTSAVTAVPGSHSIGLSGVTLAPGPSDPNSICAIVVAVQGTQNGLQTNTTGIVASNEGGSAAPATASIGVFGAGPRIYWGATLSGVASGDVQFAKLDGSVAGTLAQHDGSGGQEGTAIDAAAGRIYWLDAAHVRLAWSSLDDSKSGVVSTVGVPLADPAGLAIDPSAGLAYWANEVGPDPISFAQLNGSGGGVLDTTGASPGVAAGPALDLAQRRIYYANPTANTISYANLNGSGGGDLATTGATVNGPTGVSIDEAAGRIYWANSNGVISYANVDGSGNAHDLDTTGTNHVGPSGMVVDPSTGTVYWTNQTAAGSISFAGPGGNGTLSTPGLTPTAPAYPSLLFPPQPAGSASVSGTGSPGAKLTCLAAWAADLPESQLYRAPQTVSYQWVRDGVDVSGATATTFTAPSNGTYACRVTATNAAGTATQLSAGHPVATLSAATITAPSAMFVLSSRVTVSYSATDSAGAGAVTYDVEDERAPWNGGFGRWTSLATGTTATSRTLSVTPGNEYCVRVRAHDTAGNMTPWATKCMVSPLDDRALSLATAHWTRSTSTGAYHGTLTTTATQGAKLRIGGAQVDRIAVVVTTCSTCGTVGIYLGGTLWTTVNTHAATTHKQVILVIARFARRTTSVVLRAMDAGRRVLIDGLGIART